MADLTTSNIRIAYDTAEAYNYEAASGVSLALGDAVYFDSSGNLVKSNAGAGGTAKFAGIVVGIIGQGISVCHGGQIVGFDLSALAYGASVYLSDTAGKLGSTAGTTSVVAGKVVPVNGTKALLIGRTWSSYL